MLMTCIRTDQSTLDASASHRFEANALIGENITELNNRSPPTASAERSRLEEERLPRSLLIDL